MTDLPLQLSIKQVNDTVPGTVPRISAALRLLSSTADGSAAEWADPSDLGLSTRALTGVAYVDPSFAGAPTGCDLAPYPTIAAAIAALAGVGTIKLAPTTYVEASITVPANSRLRILAEGLATITNQIVWNAANSDELHIAGVQLPGGVGLKDANVGTGAVLLTLESLSCAAIVNANSGSAAHTHIFNLTLIGRVFGQTRLSDSSDLVLSAACVVNGAVYASNSAFLANLTCSGLFGDHVYLGPSVTLTSAGNSVLLNSEYDTGVTIALGGNGSTLFVDYATSYFARTLTGTGATQTIYRSVINASLVINDSLHVSGPHVSDALDALQAEIAAASVPIKFSFLNLTGNFSFSNIGILPAGFYNCVIELYLHTTGTSGSITVGLAWTDRMGFAHGVATVQDRGSVALVVANAYALPISVDGTHNVTHQVTGVGTAGSLQYDLHYTFTPQ